MVFLMSTHIKQTKSYVLAAEEVHRNRLCLPGRMPPLNFLAAPQCTRS